MSVYLKKIWWVLLAASFAFLLSYLIVTAIFMKYLYNMNDLVHNLEMAYGINNVSGGMASQVGIIKQVKSHLIDHHYVAGKFLIFIFVPIVYTATIYSKQIKTALLLTSGIFYFISWATGLFIHMSGNYIYGYNILLCHTYLSYASIFTTIVFLISVFFKAAKAGNKTVQWSYGLIARILAKTNHLIMVITFIFMGITGIFTNTILGYNSLLKDVTKIFQKYYIQEGLDTKLLVIWNLRSPLWDSHYVVGLVFSGACVFSLLYLLRRTPPKQNPLPFAIIFVAILLFVSGYSRYHRGTLEYMVEHASFWRGFWARTHYYTARIIPILTIMHFIHILWLQNIKYKNILINLFTSKPFVLGHYKKEKSQKNA